MSTPGITDQFKMIGQYHVVMRIGKGGFGEVYLVRDMSNQKEYAMKTEFIDSKKQAIEREVLFLRELNSPYFLSVYCSGRDQDCRYFVMDVCGPSITSLRREAPGRYIPMSCILAFAEETLKILKELHAQGFVHRDIKPSNFLLRPGNEHHLCLIDFGLAKRFIDPQTRLPYPEQNIHRFTGTNKYASPNAHMGKDLGPRDDLWSWFYSLIELTSKRLPWCLIKDKHDVGELKKSISPRELCKKSPSKFLDILSYIKTLKYEDIPDYDYLFSLIQEIRDESCIQYTGEEWLMFERFDPSACHLARECNGFPSLDDDF